MYDPYTNKTFGDDILINRADDSKNTTKRWDHYHDFYEIYYYYGNEMNYFIDNKVYTVKKNDVVFIQPYLFHRTVYRSGSTRKRILILFHPKILEYIKTLDEPLHHAISSLFSTKKILSLSSVKSKQLLHNFIMRLYETSVQSSSYQSLKMQNDLINLFITFDDLSSDEVKDKSAPMLSSKEKLVSNVIEYINHNYTYDITLETICEELFVSKYYLCHTFKETTGVTVINFVNKKRLSEAERLLRYSSQSITDICHLVGFNSIGHFINLFSKYYDCTPGTFRKRLQ
ncbi:helix-turn-helix transcriptional regulator [Blautia liquoris]|jgi:AraC-like DNA-binding protein|uniref:Helix-turn-helix transcriptional regulator n=1 Tax=Blautia liquoris TaxID=2779518 RepID=A0A7M2RH50_9FIRM|nr:AraC family transcriptional regulator [Blautia liquoris]QOV19334.1 helix-turn-helix transcriptional regulator [Blautia liquoris]